eukprot:30083-Eustigmatos_ZCMA.PRE.1
MPAPSRSRSCHAFCMLVHAGTSVIMSRTPGRSQGQPGSGDRNQHDSNGASLEMHQGRGFGGRRSSDGPTPRG